MIFSNRLAYGCISPALTNTAWSRTLCRLTRRQVEFRNADQLYMRLKYYFNHGEIMLQNSPRAPTTSQQKFNLHCSVKKSRKGRMMSCKKSNLQKDTNPSLPTAALQQSLMKLDTQRIGNSTYSTLMRQPCLVGGGDFSTSKMYI